MLLLTVLCCSVLCRAKLHPLFSSFRYTQSTYSWIAPTKQIKYREHPSNAAAFDSLLKISCKHTHTHTATTCTLMPRQMFSGCFSISRYLLQFHSIFFYLSSFGRPYTATILKILRRLLLPLLLYIVHKTNNGKINHRLYFKSRTLFSFQLI